jgi:hypothetical protein
MRWPSPDHWEDEASRVCRECGGETDGREDLCMPCVDMLRETRSDELAGIMDGPDMMPAEDSDRLAQFERDVMLCELAGPACRCSDPWCDCPGIKRDSANYPRRPRHADRLRR